MLEFSWTFRAFLEGLGSNFWRAPRLQSLEASRSLSVNRCGWSLDGPFSWPWYWGLSYSRKESTFLNMMFHVFQLVSRILFLYSKIIYWNIITCICRPSMAWLKRGGQRGQMGGTDKSAASWITNCMGWYLRIRYHQFDWHHLTVTVCLKYQSFGSAFTMKQ